MGRMPARTEQRIEQLREMAELLERHPFALDIWSIQASGWDIYVLPDNKWTTRFNTKTGDYDNVPEAEWQTADQKIADMARELRRDPAAIHEPSEKHFTKDQFIMTVKFVKGTTVRLRASRENVCTKVVTGTTTEMVPDLDNAPLVAKEVEVVEWQCSPLLGD